MSERDRKDTSRAACVLAHAATCGFDQRSAPVSTATPWTRRVHAATSCFEGLDAIVDATQLASKKRAFKKLHIEVREKEGEGLSLKSSFQKNCSLRKRF